MDNCQFCGAREAEISNKASVFTCSTRWRVGEQVAQSDTCRELCQLRERVAWLEKWREVVLWDAPTFLDDYVIEHVLCADPSDSETLRKAFDDAVRKEMK